MEIGNTPLLEVRNLCKSFPVRSPLDGRTNRLRAVTDVSFALNPGETLALVGESGCGKSTTGKLLMHLMRPDSGEILFRGEPLTGQRGRLARFRRQCQMIFQDPFSSLNPRHRVGDILAEPFLIHQFAPAGEIPQRVASLLQKVGLDPDVAERFPHEFSGGQRQRIGIARAIALEPAIIIADEPVSALDISIQAQIVNLLQDIQRERKLSYLFISHDLSVVEHISHRVAVMYLGRVVEYAPAEALFFRPRHPYTRMLLDAIPVIGKRSDLGHSIAGDPPSPLRIPTGCPFHPRCPLAIEECKATLPPMTLLEGNRGTACHRHHDL